MQSITLNYSTLILREVDWMSFNALTSLTLFKCGFEDLRELSFLKNLVNIDLQYNNIHSLQFLYGLFKLQSINLKNNQIESPDELVYLVYHTQLNQLILNNNPMVSQASFEEKLMFVLPNSDVYVSSGLDHSLAFQHFQEYKELNPFDDCTMGRLKVADTAWRQQKRLLLNLKNKNWIP